MVKFYSEFPTISSIFDEILTEHNSRTPKYDVIDESDRYLLNLSMPGMVKDDIDIEQKNGNELHIQSNKKINTNEVKYEYDSIYKGNYKVKFKLPDDCMFDNITASMDAGILSLKIPKKVYNNGVNRISIN
ncbi:MAG: Hsp20/alpha crystallin family protein [bacterium]